MFVYLCFVVIIVLVVVVVVVVLLCIVWMCGGCVVPLSLYCFAIQLCVVSMNQIQTFVQRLMAEVTML